MRLHLFSQILLRFIFLSKFQHLLIVSGAESEDKMREKNELSYNKSNKASASSSKLSEDKSSEKIEVDVFEQPKVDLFQK